MKLKQKSTIAGLLTIISAVSALLVGAVDVSVAGPQIVTGLGLVVVDA